MTSRFVCIGDMILNLDRVVDVQWFTREEPDSVAVTRHLSVTTSAAAARTVRHPDDGLAEWVTTARTHVLPDGPTARALWDLMLSRCDPPAPIGDVQGMTF